VDNNAAGNLQVSAVLAAGQSVVSYTPAKRVNRPGCCLSTAADGSPVQSATSAGHCGSPRAAESIRSEMSGSPILTEIGTAIGVVCTAAAPWEGGPNPRLTHNLPG